MAILAVGSALLGTVFGRFFRVGSPSQPDSLAFITNVSFTVFTEKSAQDLALANTLGR